MSASPSPDLSEVALALQRTCGVVFPDRDGEQVRSGLERAAKALGVEPHALLARVRLGDPAAMRALVDASVVGETYFWRHPEQLEALRAALRAEGSPRPVRVWCAGCASGEEAYTLAALLLEEGRGAPGAVLGTDVSEKALETARLGRYGAWSLRGVPDRARARWLRADGEHWTVQPEVRELTGFLRHNLVKDPPPMGGFDVVVCRNVLIYFDPPTARAVLERLFGAVRPGGLVALAPAENFFAQPLGFEELGGSGGLLWRNVRGAAPAPRPDPARRAPAASAAASSPCPPRAAPAVPSPRPPAPRPQTPPAQAGADVLEAARCAAAEGRWDNAERHAASAGEASLLPEPFLYAAAAAEARGDVEAALRWIGRALFLDPGHAVARASLVPLLERRGQREAAARARRQALDALAGIPDDQLLPGIEPVGAGALRDALAAPHRLLEVCR